MREILYLISVGILLIFSGFFSASETALFSLSRIGISRLKAEGKGRDIERLRRTPERLLSTILFSNLLVNIAASSIFTLFVITLSLRLGIPEENLLPIGTVVMVLLLLFFGEISPKVYALHRAEHFSLRVSRILRVWASVIYPITALLSGIGRVIRRSVTRVPFPTQEELKTMLELGRESGVLLNEEEEIIYSLLDLNQATVAEVMTPRIEMVCLEKSKRVKDALRLAKKSKRSRIPVYEETVDNIIGILYTKDLLGKSAEERIEPFIREAYFVVESKPLATLFEELRRRGLHIAIVVDEFGQTAGLVTLEDILEKIFGEIRDEYDTGEELPYHRVNRETYIVDGEIDLFTLDRLFKGSFKGVEFNRLSEFIQHRMGRLPSPGEGFQYKDIFLEIKEMRGHRIEKVLIKKIKR